MNITFIDRKNEVLYRELQSVLTPKRLLHTLGTMETARALARQFGADETKAETAALYHDRFRDADPGEAARLLREYGLPVQRPIHPALAHGPLAAAFMEQERQITDPDILSAVRWHTTGRFGMSKLEMVLYLADAVEPSRNYPGVDTLRQAAAGDGLQTACAAVVRHTLDYLKQNNQTVEQDTVRALVWLTGKEKYMESRELALKTARILSGKKGLDIVVIDIAAQSSFADFFVLATGSTERQVGSLADEVEQQLAKMGVLPRNIEGKPASCWVLLDYGDVIVNVFGREQRETYQIEKIWGDGNFIDSEEFES